VQGILGFDDHHRTLLVLVSCHDPDGGGRMGGRNNSNDNEKTAKPGKRPRRELSLGFSGEWMFAGR
jgi:hypothetical protein